MRILWYHQVEMHTGGPATKISADYGYYDANIRWSIATAAADGHTELVCSGGPYYETWTSTLHSPPSVGDRGDDDVPVAAADTCCLLPETEYVLNCVNSDGAGWYNGFLTVAGVSYCQQCVDHECHEQTHVIMAEAASGSEDNSEAYNPWSTWGVYLAIHEILFLALSFFLIMLNPGVLLLSLQATLADERISQDNGEFKSGAEAVQWYVFMPQCLVWVLLCESTEFIETRCSAALKKAYEYVGAFIAFVLAWALFMSLGAFFHAVGAGTITSTPVLVGHVLIVGSMLAFVLYTGYNDTKDHGDAEDFKWALAALVCIFILLPFFIGLLADDQAPNPPHDPDETCATTCTCVPDLTTDGSETGACSAVALGSSSSGVLRVQPWCAQWTLSATVLALCAHALA
eukprot:COSAG05_NODE_268_length_12518_cov_6.452774_13_plen_402_part_00